MKKFVSLLLTVVLLATMLTVFAVPAFAEGEPGDSADNPILVTNANWGSLCNKLQAGKYYKLVEDIGSENKRIGKSIGNVPEGTHFDGNGYTIWVKITNYVFGNNKGEIYNLTVAGSITVRNAVFCNSNYGIISHCINRADIKNDSECASGICKMNNGTVCFCENYGDITGSEASGICYRNDGIVCNCINHGEMVASFNGAGICCLNTKTVLNCVNTGSVNAKVSGCGICCSGNGSTIALCFNCGLPTEDGVFDYVTGVGSFTDCWYMQSENGNTCISNGKNDVAVDDIDNLLSQINAKVEEYRQKYTDIELCNWKIGKNNLPTPDLSEGGMQAEETSSYEGSILSEGNIWIIAIIAVVVIAGIATLVIVKKKKKPALAGGTENTELSE